MNTITTINRLSKKENIFYWIIAVFLYMSFFPYFVWYNFLTPLTTYALIVIFFTQIKNHNIVYLMAFGFISFWGAICCNSTVFGVAMLCTYAFIFANDDLLLIQVYKRFRVIYVVLIALSMVVYLLVNMGVPMPYRVSPPPPRNTMEYDFFIYPFYACQSVDDWRNLGINRFNGLFDEPGTIGTLSFLILFIEKFDFKRVGNIILLISGIISFSLYFYLAFVIYGVYFLLFKRSTRTITKIIVSVVFVFAFLRFSGTEIYQAFIGYRLEWESSTSTIVGDDRSSTGLIQYIKEIRGTSDYYFGNPNMVSKFEKSASIEKQIVMFGAITIALFFLFFVCYSYKYLHSSKEWLLFCVVFFSLMYNRPTMFSYGRLFLLILVIFAWSKQYEECFSLSNKSFFNNHLLSRL